MEVLARLRAARSHPCHHLVGRRVAVRRELQWSGEEANLKTEPV